MWLFLSKKQTKTAKNKQKTTKRDGLFWLKEILKCRSNKEYKGVKMKGRKIKLNKIEIKNKEKE